MYMAEKSVFSGTNLAGEIRFLNSLPWLQKPDLFFCISNQITAESHQKPSYLVKVRVNTLNLCPSRQRNSWSVIKSDIFKDVSVILTICFLAIKIFPVEHHELHFNLFSKQKWNLLMSPKLWLKLYEAALCFSSAPESCQMLELQDRSVGCVLQSFNSTWAFKLLLCRCDLAEPANCFPGHARQFWPISQEFSTSGKLHDRIPGFPGRIGNTDQWITDEYCVKLLMWKNVSVS